MEKKNTKFQIDIPMNIYVTYNLYKLAHMSMYLHYYELFTIVKSNVHLGLHDLCS
jgi:hypothetical protein